jgi:hypothetical protein
MSLCILHQDGALLGHRTRPAGPDPFRKALAPSREDLVVGGAGLFPWDGLADLCARAGMPCVLGHARSLHALHGGQATNATIDAQTSALRFRGGLWPHASVSPAALRATRDLLRRRLPLMRHRAARLAPLHHTPRQDQLPALGQKSASKAHRAAGAERCAEPAVPHRVAGALALLEHDAPRLRHVALSLRHPATPHHATPRSLRRTVPGIGAILRCVRLSAIPDLQRCPRGHAGVASCRLVTWARAAAGPRSGTSGAQSGPASLPWACAAAAGWGLRTHPAGQHALARLEHHQGQGQAVTGRAPTLARAVSSRFKRATACERPRCCQRAPGAERVRLTPHWTSPGGA